MKIQQVGAINYQMNAGYNFANAVTSLTYPSGRTITNSYDPAGRLLTFTGNLGDGTTRAYATGVLYSPGGALTKEQFGTTTPVYNKRFYNSRGQLAEIRASTSYTGPTDVDSNRGALVNNYSNQCTGMCSGLPMTDNNGNLRKQEIHIPSHQMRWQQYEYDSLNRLKWAREVLNGGAEQWKQQFTYDRWGNRTIDAANTYGTAINEKAFTVNASNNRLGVPAGQSGVMTYDAVGNLTNDTYTGAGNRTYDGENKITSAWGGNNQAQLYKYDGSGQRIKRTVNGVETWHVYGFGGELLAEYGANGAPASPQKEYGYRNGQLLVTAAPGTSNSLSLNGASAYMQAPNSSSLNVVGPITVEAWIKISAIGANRAIISREAFQQSGAGGGYRLSITDTGKVRLDLFQTHNTYVNVSGATTITVGVWHHVAGVFDGTQLRVYLNGVLDGTLSTTNGPTTGTGNLHIGRFSYSLNPYYFNGLIDEARVSNTALYNSTFIPQPNLTASGSTKGLWKFDGQSASDSSGNNNNVTSQGGATYASDVPGSGGTTGIQINWLITDHLGTPRLIIDSSGSLAGVKRHDYLPFGEELFAGMGGRTAAQGYSGGDGVRQQFTGKERDVETGLDYSGARYYGAISGRLCSPDNFLNDTHVSVPQSWNLYSYVHNNPLVYIDPTGEVVDGTDLSPEERQQLIDDWKKKTGYKDIQFKDQNGRSVLIINLDAGFENGSETARKEILAAQKSSFIFDLQSVKVENRGQPVEFAETGLPRVDRSRGGLVFNVRIDFADFNELRGDKEAVEANSIGLAVLHEIEHSLHGQTGDSGSAPGDVERKYINPIRRELGLPERQFYAPNHFSQGGQKYEFLFYRSTNETRKIVYWNKSQVTRTGKQ